MSEQSKDGGPAFPSQEQMNGNGDAIVWGTPGMSLRDWFATHALNAFCTAHLVMTDNEEVAETERRFKAESAYRMADAMLAARSTPPAKGD
jgi:hypothetical protein